MERARPYCEEQAVTPERAVLVAEAIERLEEALTAAGYPPLADEDAWEELA